MKKLKQGVFPLLYLLVCLFTSCKPDTSENGPGADLSTVRFQDFVLSETAYITINVSHPEVRNGVEVTQGSILIKIPRGTTQLRLTPMLANFSNEKYTVSPRLGEIQNFSGGAVRYTIASVQNPEKQVHYLVTIEEEPGTTPQQAEITSFLFEKAKNPGLASSIEGAIIHPENGSFGKIYIFVPVGTDYSNLKPTILFNGTGLFYSQDANSSPANSTTAYPAAGVSVDFAYPKVFYAVVKRGTDIKTYDVIVDVRNPIRIDNAVVTTPDLAKGSTHFLQVASILNQGNHPIAIAAVSHRNQVPAGLTVIRASGAVPSFGLIPGESTAIHATISAQTFPPGTYQTTADIAPKFQGDQASTAMLEAATVSITATIKE